MDFDTFRNEILGWVQHRDLKLKEWRSGQAVFNYIDEVYKVARRVQFEDKIDCFYDDSKIDDFIIASYRKLCGG